jgi:two-component system, OmpR family, sensor histidine kinase PhoQ
LNHSIQSRLLITTTFVLVVFLTITGWILDRSFRTSVVTGAEEQLRLVIYSLMGSVQEQDGQLTFSQGVAEPRLTQPDSGLYAQVAGESNEVIWVSPSAATTSVDFPRVQTQPGLFVFREVDGAAARFHLSYTVIWEGVDTEYVVFSAATDQQPFRIAINQFRRSLGIGLGAVTALFIMAQLLALRWGLLPLRTMAAEVQELESGEREALSRVYPRELEGLAENLGRFIDHEQRSRTRYRNALDDLAHSLKTPLAVVRNSLLEPTPDKTLVSEQLERMETTVTHQLTKASAAGPVVVGKSVDVGQLVERLLRALQTAYLDRAINVEKQLDEAVFVRGDERDFMEIIGNLLENAFKYTDNAVRVSVTTGQNPGSSATITIEDNGEGIPPTLRDEVLRRGRRLDQIESGQGIGLAVVAELVALYNGSLEITDSSLGGARLTVLLP